MTKFTLGVYSTYMKCAEPTETKLFRIQGKVEPIVRQRAKASAALRGISLEDWITEAVKEKLEREGMR